MTDRHPPVRDPNPKAVTVWHPTTEKVAPGCSVDATIEPRCATGFSRPEGD